MFNVGGGLAYMIVHDFGLLGRDDWFLLSAPSSRWADWQGPWLIPKPASPESRTLNLVYSEDRGILIAFTTKHNAMLEPLNPVAAGCLPKISLEGVTKLVSVKEVKQDSDGDGWTDLEEERLGLDPHEIDSDGDGSPDGRDVCPDYAPGPEDARNENLRILQKAIFATFGLTGSRDLLLVDQGSEKLQVWGYEGPILYDTSRDQGTQHRTGGLRVKWRITSKSETEAEVSISDYAGPLAAGGLSVRLRRIAGEWYVIERRTGWVS
jgi:hypothetical protein